MTESPRKTGRNLENIPSHVKKRLSKIIEDENGDEDGAQPRPDHQDNDWVDAENENDDNDSLLNLDDEDSSDDEEEEPSQKDAKKEQPATADKEKKDEVVAEKEAPPVVKKEHSPSGIKNSLTDGLNQMSAEELKQLKLLMGSNFKDIQMPEAEDALPLSSHHRYQGDDDDYMKRKLRNM